MARHYSSDCCGPSSIYQGSIKAPWGFICQTIALVVGRVRRCLGDGSTTSFWNDSWLICGVLSIVFPKLFRIALYPKATVAKVWIPSTDDWNLQLHCNLTKLEILEWASLSHPLYSVRSFPSCDSWIWSLYPSLGFTVTPLMADLVGAVDPFLTDIYSVIWKDCSPNKIKIFL